MMKYLKLFIILAVAVPFLSSCSDDDDVNTAECTVGFQSSAQTVSEVAGYVNIPITVSGRRNGPVKVTIEAAPTGDSPAVEGENYAITDKTLRLNADTLSTGTINVEVRIIDDSELNDNRQFTLTIASAEGAEISTQQTTITIKDNESDVYQAFFGDYTMSGTLTNSSGTGSFSTTVTVSGATDETSSDYNNFLKVGSDGDLMSKMVGASIECTWRLRYSYDVDNNIGTLGIICGEQVASYSSYQWMWATDNGQSYTTDDVTASWALDENNKVPTTITFPQSSALYLYDDGIWAILENITLTKN